VIVGHEATRLLVNSDSGRLTAWAQDAVNIAKQLHAQNPALYDSFGSFRSNMLSLVRADGALELYDGVIRARDEAGKIIFDGASDQSYLDLIEEEVKPWTYMKFPFLKSVGPEHGWYRVGPLARLQNCDFIPSPLAEAQRREFVAWGQGSPVHADSAALHTLVAAMLAAVPDGAVRVLRDPTRGGLATTLNEIAQQSGVGMLLQEAAIPVLPQVAAACELLGLDPLYIANEGKLVAIVAPEAARAVLAAMRAHPLGQRAAQIGQVSEDANRFVQMSTAFGGRRVVDWLSGEPLPRIC